jgi:hypothetical protein
MKAHPMKQQNPSWKNLVNKGISGVGWFFDNIITSAKGSKSFTRYFELNAAPTNEYTIRCRNKNPRERYYKELIIYRLYHVPGGQVSEFLQYHYQKFDGAKTSFLDYSRDLFSAMMVAEQNKSQPIRDFEDHSGRLNAALAWLDLRYQDLRYYSQVSVEQQLQDIILQQESTIRQLKTELDEFQKDKLIFNEALSESEIIDVFYQLSTRRFGKVTDTVLMSPQREISRIIPRFIGNIHIQPETIRNYFKFENKRIPADERRVSVFVDENKK